MWSMRTICCLCLFLGIPLGSASASPGVIAGSELASPPPFWENSFWGITSNIDRAFSFTTALGGPYSVSELQVAAYHYQGLAGDSAGFTIRSDAQGEPGAVMTTFLINDIGTVAQVHSLVPASSVVLDSNTLYWIVGQNDYGQVNWNLGDNAFGETAYRVEGGDWVVQQGRNVSAFAFLGTLIPEPSSIILLGLPGLGVLCRRRERPGQVH